MADRKENVPQLLALLLQTIVPLVIAGGATGILAVFKEQLPQLLYTIFLYVIWGVIIVMLIWLVLRLIVGDLPEKINNWIKARTKKRATLKQVDEWFGKWLELSRLVATMIEMPEEHIEGHQDKYTELHIWFTNNRSKFLPVWHYFTNNRTETAHEHDYNSTTDLGYKIFRKNYRDPFSIFYSPLLVTQLRQFLRRWHNDKVRGQLAKLSDLTDEFVEWVKHKY